MSLFAKFLSKFLFSNSSSSFIAYSVFAYKELRNGLLLLFRYGEICEAFILSLKNCTLLFDSSSATLSPKYISISFLVYELSKPPEYFEPLRSFRLGGDLDNELILVGDFLVQFLDELMLDSLFLRCKCILIYADKGMLS
jgi:hypothetical protein